MIQEKKAAVDQFNREQDDKLAQLAAKFENGEKKLEEKHLKKLEEDMTAWEETFPRQPKYSTKLLNDKKILEGYIKSEQ